MGDKVCTWTSASSFLYRRPPQTPGATRGRRKGRPQGGESPPTGETPTGPPPAGEPGTEAPQGGPHPGRGGAAQGDPDPNPGGRRPKAAPTPTQEGGRRHKNKIESQGKRSPQHDDHYTVNTNHHPNTIIPFCTPPRPRGRTGL